MCKRDCLGSFPDFFLLFVPLGGLPLLEYLLYFNLSLSFSGGLVDVTSIPSLEISALLWGTLLGFVFPFVFSLRFTLILKLGP